MFLISLGNLKGKFPLQGFSFNSFFSSFFFLLHVIKEMQFLSNVVQNIVKFKNRRDMTYLGHSPSQISRNNPVSYNIQFSLPL